MHTLRLWDGYDGTSPELADEVSTLQRQLQEHGYYEADVDGLFGRYTDQCVRLFQGAKLIEVDGIVGPITWAALDGENPKEEDQWPTTLKADSSIMLAQLDRVRTYKVSSIIPGRNDCALICGIGSRESGWGSALKPTGPGGTGDFTHRRYPTGLRQGPLPPDGGGFGRGLLQIDWDAHPFARGTMWTDASANIRYGFSVLQQSVIYVRSKVPELSIMQQLRAGVAGYNCGPGNVVTALKTRRDVDFFTTGRDYSADVMNRAGWFFRYYNGA